MVAARRGTSVSLLLGNHEMVLTLPGSGSGWPGATVPGSPDRHRRAVGRLGPGPAAAAAAQALAGANLKCNRDYYRRSVSNDFTIFKWSLCGQELDLNLKLV